MLLKGKNAVVTGVLRGIGRKTMDIFAENGANIFACAQREDEEFLTHIKMLSNKHSVSIIPLFFDLNSEEEIKGAMKQIFSTKMPIDILVNIAGMTHNALFTMTTLDKFKEVMNIDFFSQMLVSQFIAKIMIKNKKGSIINVSSITGIDGNNGQVAYSAAKAALIGATKTMARELGENNIRVNAIAPGVIKTAMTDELTENQLAELLQGASLGRVGLPEEVANVLLYLGSDLSEYVTGQVIRVDGGIGG